MHAAGSVMTSVLSGECGKREGEVGGGGVWGGRGVVMDDPLTQSGDPGDTSQL